MHLNGSFKNLMQFAVSLQTQNAIMKMAMKVTALEAVNFFFLNCLNQSVGSKHSTHMSRYCYD
jgi:hypothetical protein